ncbi:MAG: hypothetical protein ACQESP_09755 [Candidatus Muiribacteriota bacterium]
MKKLILILTLMVTTVLFAADFNVEAEVHEIINTHWEANDALYEGHEEIYIDNLRAIDNNMEELAAYLKSNPEKISELSDVLAEVPKESKHLFNRLVKELESMDREELFPGYGFQDPDYHYRRGEEVEKELLQQYWKTEERYFESNKRHKFMIELSVAQKMKAGANAGAPIEGFDVKGVVEMEVNGQMKEVAETEFSTKETLSSKATVMYEKNKVYYEVYRAKKGFWDFLPWKELDWELSGTTYLIHEEATETEVVLDPPPLR